jgi:hypothetical protein
MNIEMVGLPCSGKTTIVNRVLDSPRVLHKRARLRNRAFHVLLNPSLLMPLLRLLKVIFRSKKNFLSSLVRSINMMPLSEFSQLIADEGMVVYASAIGLDPTNADFSYINRINSTIYVFIEPNEDVLNKQMKLRGRAGIEQSVSDTGFKVSFEDRKQCFENWKIYFKANNIQFLEVCEEELNNIHINLRAVLSEWE